MPPKKEDTAPIIHPDARIIQLETPLCTPKEFARRSGMSESAVRGQIARGNLPTTRLEKNLKGGTILVNLMKLAEDALNTEY